LFRVHIPSRLAFVAAIGLIAGACRDSAPGFGLTLPAARVNADEFLYSV